MRSILAPSREQSREQATSFCERGEPPHFAAPLVPKNPSASLYLTRVVHPLAPRTARVQYPLVAQLAELFALSHRHSRCPFAHSLSSSLLSLTHISLSLHTCAVAPVSHLPPCPHCYTVSHCRSVLYGCVMLLVCHVIVVP